jgi:serine/threonine protein kinase
MPWASRDNASLVREIINGEVVCPVHMISEIAQIVELCTRKNPSERPTAGELLDLPWVSEGLITYNRVFGFNGRLPMTALKEGGCLSLGKMGTLGSRSSAKLILSKPTIRQVTSFEGTGGFRISNAFCA